MSGDRQTDQKHVSPFLSFLCLLSCVYTLKSAMFDIRWYVGTTAVDQIRAPSSPLSCFRQWPAPDAFKEDVKAPGWIVSS